jgi:DNA-binding LytR/AlgR family response regulator
MNLNCLVIDDEPLAQDILIKYIKEVSSLQLSGVFEDALAAGDYLREKGSDLLFLDINMPGLSGMDFLRSLNDPPMIIFTTAYSEFAVEGFEADAVDYLLKPFSFGRFLKAVNKAFERSRHLRVNQGEPVILWFKSDKKLHKVIPEEIYFLKSVGDYVQIAGEEGQILVHETIKELTNQLEVHGIRRIHRSWSVALQKIEYIEGNRVIISGQEIPIGRAYREDFLRNLHVDKSGKTE